jgi:hypothetical protein
LGERTGKHIQTVRGGGPGGAKNRDFVDLAVRGEHFEGSSHFFDRRTGDFEIKATAARVRKAKGSKNDFANHVPVAFDCDVIQKRLD